MTEDTKKADRLNALNSRFREQYKNAKASTMWHGLIVGQKGAGKTWLLKTMPKPIFIFNFDPQGTDTLLSEKKAGDILVEEYQDTDFSNPSAYENFRVDINKMASSGFLSQFATVCIDSLTLLQSAMVQHLLKKNGRLIPESGVLDQTKHGMRLADWGTVLNLMKLHVTQLHCLPVHTLMTGHISKEIDKVNGGLIKMLNLGGQARNHVPYLTSEVYYLLVDKESKRELILGSGDYEASSRLNGGQMTARVNPDIGKIIEMVGLDGTDKDWRP